MKKLTADHKAWLAHHASQSLRSRITRRQSGRRPIIEGAAVVSGYSRGQTRDVLLAKNSRPMPSVLCFDINYEETVEFLGKLAREICVNARKVRMGWRMPPHKRHWHDFKDIEYISPSVALVLAAEYDRGRIIAKTKQMFAVNMESWDADVRNLLEDLGFMALLGIDEAPNTLADGQTIVRFRSDTKKNVDMRLASDTLKEVIRLAANAAVVSVGEDVLSNFRTFLLAIGEALINTSDHAYPGNPTTSLPSVERWWITGAVDPARRILTFIVYDQGVTIPRAIPHGRRFEKVQRFFRRLAGRDLDVDNVALDGQSIASAVRAGASGTGLEHRGKGLGLMRSCIRRERTGQLRIISRNGDYMACSGSKDQHRTRQAALHGTLVEWTVNL